MPGGWPLTHSRRNAATGKHYDACSATASGGHGHSGLAAKLVSATRAEHVWRAAAGLARPADHYPLNDHD